MEYNYVIRSSFFQSNWLEQLLKDCKREEIEHGKTMMLPKKHCQIAWNITVLLGCQEYGVPGQVRLLAERYFPLMLSSIVKIPDPVIRAVKLGYFEDRAALTIGCVALLVVKNYSQNLKATALRLQTVLLRYNKHYTLDEIIKTEFNIFKVLGFRIPLWNTVDIAKALALELHLPKHKDERLAIMIDTVEYLKSDMDRKMRSFGYFTSKVKYSNNIRSLHLAAAVVAAMVAREHDYCHLLNDLSFLIKVPHNYLKTLRDVIIKVMDLNLNHLFPWRLNN